MKVRRLKMASRYMRNLSYDGKKRTLSHDDLDSSFRDKLAPDDSESQGQ
jgi:hypothetical protein